MSESTPLTDEFSALLNAAQEWLTRTTAEHPIATGAAECQYCPVCQLISALRGDRPELTEKLVDLVNGFVVGLRDAFERPAKENASSRVQHIDLDEQ